jgi:TRAP-type C4-dicarboxylate transport system permease small subunit
VEESLMRLSEQRLEALAGLLLHRVPLTLAALLLLVAIAINFANVVARYAFLAAFYWAEEVMIYLSIWSIFLAAAAVTYDGKHLTMDLFFARLAPSRRRALQAFIAAGCVATFGLMAWQSFEVVRLLARNDQRSIALDMPMVVPHAALLVGFALCAAAVVCRLFFRRSSVVQDDREDIVGRPS